MPRSRAPETVALDDIIIDIVRARHPQTVRQVYYRLVSRGQVPKTEKGYEKVIQRLGWLRKQRVLPFSWIVDPGRGYNMPYNYKNPGDLLQRYAHAYSTTPWYDQPGRDATWEDEYIWGSEVRDKQMHLYPVVAVESRSLASIVEPTCRRWSVPLYPLGGQPSITLLYELSESYHRHLEWPDRLPMPPDIDDRQLSCYGMLYIGDYDPAGLSIEETMQTHLFNDFKMSFAHWERLAITEEQAADLHAEGLSGDRKAGEKRHPEVEYTVEAEAMDADDICELLDERLAEILPRNIRDAVSAADDREIERLRRLGEIVGRDGLEATLARLDGGDAPPDTRIDGLTDEDWGRLDRIESLAEDIRDLARTSLGRDRRLAE